MKISRNDPCPCGSGMKYKKCCYGKKASQPANPAPQQTVTLAGEIEKLQEKAIKKEKMVKILGVFIMLATEEGDGWILEITEKDALQVATNGEKLEFDLKENPETIEVNWSHRFAIKNKKFVTTTYSDDSEQVWDNYPAHSIAASIKRIEKKLPEEMLEKIHLDDEEAGANQED